MFRVAEHDWFTTPGTAPDRTSDLSAGVNQNLVQIKTELNQGIGPPPRIPGSHYFFIGNCYSGAPQSCQMRWTTVIHLNQLNHSPDQNPDRTRPTTNPYPTKPAPDPTKPDQTRNHDPDPTKPGLNPTKSGPEPDQPYPTKPGDPTYQTRPNPVLARFGSILARFGPGLARFGLVWLRYGSV